MSPQPETVAASVPVGIPTLKRTDLLAQLVASLVAGTVRPSAIYVVNNGAADVVAALVDAGLMLCNQSTVGHHTTVGVVPIVEDAAALGAAVPLHVYTPPHALGLAESWNWMIARTEPDDVMILNDDVRFPPPAFAAMLAVDAPFVSALAGSNAFSAFLLRRACVEAVGLFDESISPGYAYFEDNDYAERMDAAGIAITGIDCAVEHLHSQTFAAMTDAEKARHHARFEMARKNYVAKHGRHPRGWIGGDR